MEEVDGFIAMIVRQTNYSEEEARLKLAENENNPLKVIRLFLRLVDDDGVKNDSVLIIPKEEVQREIFKQIRQMLYINPDRIAACLNQT